MGRVQGACPEQGSFKVLKSGGLRGGQDGEGVLGRRQRVDKGREM